MGGGEGGVSAPTRARLSESVGARGEHRGALERTATPAGVPQTGAGRHHPPGVLLTLESALFLLGIKGRVRVIQSFSTPDASGTGTDTHAGVTSCLTWTF